MTHEEKNLQRVRHLRIRRVKRLLRPLPRRATIHRYPVLKWFAQTARARSYLWSFRPQHVVRALYAGCILAMLPIYGFQLLAAFVVALVLRANLMFMVALVLITNPFTFVPLYAADFAVGDWLLRLCFAAPEFQILEWIKRIPQFFESPSAYMDYLQANGLASKLPYFFGALTLGGFVLGTLMGGVCHAIYVGVRHGLRRRMHFLEEQVRQLGRRLTQHPFGGVRVGSGSPFKREAAKGDPPPAVAPETAAPAKPEKAQTPEAVNH
ncbi:MAG: DUF2062 domain-containing protein [Opitutales bacterium]